MGVPDGWSPTTGSGLQAGSFAPRSPFRRSRRTFRRSNPSWLGTTYPLRGKLSQSAAKPRRRSQTIRVNTNMVTLLSSLGAALLGGLVVYATSQRGETKSTLRDLRVELLVRTYRTLIECHRHKSITAQDADELTKSMNDLMLLGNRREIDAVTGMMAQARLDADGTIEFTEVLLALRDDLRAELGLHQLEFSEFDATFLGFEPPDRPRNRAEKPRR
jgi:hypothetical protein